LLPDSTRWGYEFVEMRLAQVKLIFSVSIGNGDGTDCICVIAVKITCEHDASCLGHGVDYAPCRAKTLFAWAEVDVP
jgi:hypothetical protein